jgi:hypothetical protein
VTFSAVVILIVGSFNVIWGYGALDKKELFNESSLVYSNLSFWGWSFIVIGALQVLTAFLLFVRRVGGAILAGIGAAFSAVVAFLALFGNTEWSLAILALDILIVWAIFGHMEDFE